MIQQIYPSKAFCRGCSQRRLTPAHDSPASFSTNRPQIMYLFVKCSIQPFIFSLEGETESHKRQHSRQRKRGGSNTNISSGVRSSSLSSGWSIGVNISMRSQTSQRSRALAERKRGMPRSNDCFAIPRDASRPAKLPYIPSRKSSVITASYLGKIEGTECSPGP